MTVRSFARDLIFDSIKKLLFQIHILYHNSLLAETLGLAVEIAIFDGLALVEFFLTFADRDDEFEAEDAEYFAAIQRRRTILLILIAIVVVLVGFILFRIISKEMERRRREREARLLAEQQAARERALWEAKDDGMEVTMSVEETRRMELQENAISMAKEHPEDVAMLIRTWLMEE